MPGFKFKLQRVLEIKERKEELLKNELAQANRAYQEERKRLNELEEIKERHLSDFSRAQTQEFLKISDLKIRLRFIEKLATDLISQELKVRETRQKVEEVKERLINASQEKRILERLKEKHYKEFMIEEDKKEEQALDEMALSMYFREAGQLAFKK